jgi:hypothetical protein
VREASLRLVQNLRSIVLIALTIAVFQPIILSTVVQPAKADTTTPGTLDGLWTGVSYFERETYTSPYDLSLCPSYCQPVHEVAPVALDANNIYMYYRSYKRTADPTRPSHGEIGLATSTDGGTSFTFWNSGLPVVPRGMNCDTDWDFTYAVAPSVVRVDSTHWYMVYEGSNTNCAGAYNRGSIGWATSSDGKTWQKKGILLAGIADWEIGSLGLGNIGTPFVGYFNQKFYVFYHGYDGARSQIGFASGPDLSSLTRFGSPVIYNPDVDHWDWYVDSRASIIQEGSYYYMTFEGSTNPDPACTSGNWGWGIARTTTTNLDKGIWEKYPFNPIRQTYNGGCGNDLPYLFRFNNNIYVYQREQGRRNHLWSGLSVSSVAGSDASIKDGYLYVWRANVQCQTYHKLGYLDGASWAAATGSGQGHMCYGPYAFLTNGHYLVSFRDKEDVVQCAYCVNVVNNEVYDSSSSTSILRIDVNRPAFLVPDTYNSLNYQFCATGTDNYEFRTWFYDTALIHQDSVFVRWLEPGNDCAPSGGGGGGGSVAAGTMITLSDRSTLPVQDLKVGMSLLSYNMNTNQFVDSTIARFTTVVVHNEMRITTSQGESLTTDQNPAQRLYVMFPNGTWTLLPVTELKVGYRLFDPIGQNWVPITHIHYKNSGTYIMYDIYPTDPGNYIANGYLDPLKT